MYIESTVNELIDELSEYNIDYSIDGIANHLNILVIYNEHLSCYMYYKNYDIIYIKKDKPQQMWKDFTHELGHFMLHETNQQNANDMMNYKNECEAEKFSLLFRMPQQIIEDNELFNESLIMDFFNEHQQNARERLSLLFNHYSSTVGY